MNRRVSAKTLLRTLSVVFCIALSISLILLPSSAAIVDEERSIDFSGRGVGYSAVLYDNTNGLPTSEANDIVQSDDGFIWIGGYSGLTRYDGNEFYRYTTPGIASVVCLYYDSMRNLWIGTNDSGVAKLRNNAFTFYSLNEGLPSASVRSIAEDQKGNIIIATTSGLSYVSKDGKVHALSDKRLDKDYVCELYTGVDSVIYGVTLDGDFFTIKNLKITSFYSSSDIGAENVNTLYPDPEHAGFVYIGTQEGKILYGSIKDNFKKITTLKTDPLETINCIRFYDGILWVSADTGIGLFNEDHQFVQLLDLPMTNSIDHILQDYEGNLWFASSRQGVMKIVANRFVDLSAKAGLEPLVVNSTCLLGDELYVGTDTGLVVLDKERQKTENELTNLLEGVRIRCIIKDRADRLWFCTYSNNGLVCFDSKTKAISYYNEENGLLSSRVRMVKELKDGTLAIATNNGVNLIKEKKIIASYSSNLDIENLEILCLEQSENNELLLGSDGGGIYIIKDNKLAGHYGVENGLESEVILRIKKDPKDDIYWIITSNSIAYLKNDRIKTVHSFPYSNNFDLFFDKEDRTWVLSSNGIYVVNRNELIKDSIQEFTLFDKGYGLPSITTANSHSCITEEGELFVSATTGIFSCNINEETTKNNDVILSIPYIMVDDEMIWLQGETKVEISSRCKRLNICANALTYALINPHLQYRLEGFDEEYTSLTKQDMDYASYTNLRGGDYKFVISIVDDVTGKVVKTASLKIVKEKAIHEQVWFRILIVLLGIGVIVLIAILIYKRKTAALLRKQEETKELVDEMIKVFSGCIDMKDAYTNGHSARVAKYTAMLAEKLGKTPDEVDEIYKIALLHDIGKIGVPDNILNKPGRLDDEEFVIMKSHAQLGHDILKDVKIDQNLAQGAGYHHEKYDGSGYPSHLKGEEIPEIARIIAVADAFDAMYSTRVYRKKMPLEDVAAEIKRCSGTQFAPEVVEVFLQLVEEGKFDDDSVQ